ncbi:MAG: MBL fold metallo-hydrolase [Patescibacteria group bacterium]
MIKYESYTLGELQTNSFIVWNESSKFGVIIDPAEDGVFLSEEVQRLGVKPVGVLVSHGHFDHALAVLDLILIFDIPFYCSQKDFFLLDRQSKTATHFLGRNVNIPDIKKIDNDLECIQKVDLGNETLEVIKTPGHTPGSVCFYNENSKLLFTGDTLFAGTRGRTDLSYSSTKSIYQSLKCLMELPPDTIVLPGHGNDTTIARERSLYSF